MDDFDEFYVDAEPRFRRALVAALGTSRGREATVEALSFAWERWDQVRTMARPLAYLFRVGQTRSQTRPQRVVFPAPAEAGMPWIEPALPQALLSLSTHQRVCVVLAHGYGWTHREVADLLEVSTSTVQNHVERAMTKLRNALEVDAHE